MTYTDRYRLLTQQHRHEADIRARGVLAAVAPYSVPEQRGRVVP